MNHERDKGTKGLRRKRRSVPLGQRIGYQLMASVLKSVTITIAGHRWRGVENLPESGGFIVCPNHLSEIDPVIVGHMLWDVGYRPQFLAKESLFKIPVLGRILTWGQQIPVKRGTLSAGDSVERARRSLAEGGTVVIYPEGTLTRDPEFWPMKGKAGAARLAVETGVPVIPVAHWGVQDVLPPYARKPRLFPRGRFDVLVGPPVDFSDLLEQGSGDQRVNGQKLQQITERIQARTAELLGILRDETPPATRWTPPKKKTSDQPASESHASDPVS